MVIKFKRDQLFLFGVFIIALFVMLNRFDFIANSKTATGEVISIRPVSKSHSAPIIRFKTPTSVVTFQGETDLNYTIGEIVPVIYKNPDPIIAKIYTFEGFWVTTIVWGVLPFIVLLAAVYSFVDKNQIVVIELRKIFGLKK